MENTLHEKASAGAKLAGITDVCRTRGDNPISIHHGGEKKDDDNGAIFASEFNCSATDLP